MDHLPTIEKKPSQYVDLIRMADSYKLSRIFLTAVELNIFEAVGHEELTAKDIAAHTGTDERATELLLNALASLSLLEKEGGMYRNAPAILEILGQNSCCSLLAAFRHRSNSWHSWSALSQVVQKGYAENIPWSGRRSIDCAMTMRLGAGDIARRLDLLIDFRGIRRICDMGCGPGAICMKLLQKHPHLTAIMIDHDSYALDIASREAMAKGLQDRVEIVHGDILNEDIQEHFDMVIMSLVLCLFNRGEVVRLLKKTKGMLLPGGILVLGEILREQCKKDQVSTSLFDLQLLVTGSRGNLFSLEDMCELMSDCGIQYERSFLAGLQHIIVGRHEPK